MDELVLTDIAKQVFSIDSEYINARIGTIERVTEWNADLYLNWRSHLLKRKCSDTKLLARVDKNPMHECFLSFN